MNLFTEIPDPMFEQISEEEEIVETMSLGGQKKETTIK